MYKYKYFLLFFCAIAVLLLWFFFPISFDNNDDQTMYAICSGIMSGIPSSNIILSNIYIGKFLTNAFSYSGKINWYTLYLQVAQLLSFLYICRFFISKKENELLSSLLIVLIVFLGFFSLSIVKLQFTTVALVCCFSALLSMQSEENKISNIAISCLFVTLAILIRKDTFFIFILFSVTLLFKREKTENFISIFISVVLFAVLFFCWSAYANNNNRIYQQYQTYPNVQALDIIAASPIKINETSLKENNFTKDDISLMQSWLVADDAYLAGKKIEKLALYQKANRSFSEGIKEFKKFIADERYLLMLYILTVLAVFILTHNLSNVVIVNFLLFVGLIIYLIITSRIPHRVTFPILTYLILVNIGLFLESQNVPTVKTAFLSLLLILCAYKFYCTMKLIPIHKENHAVFLACQHEIKSHPESLFIAADGFPLQYMNAWQTTENAFPAHNLILGGWYACSPDYQTVLKQNGLRNLTSDLRKKKEVFFLSNSAALQHSYIQVMKQRYQINCHFEEQLQGFQVLKPKRLVFEN